MGMLRWVCGPTTVDTIRNKKIGVVLVYYVGRTGGRSKWLDRLTDYIRNKGLSGGGSVRPYYMEKYTIIHRPHMNAGVR